MKKTGNTSEFLPERDRELHRAFMHLLRTRTDLPLREMYGEAALQPCSRFWVSEQRAAIVVSRMRKGFPVEDMINSRLRMFVEINKRVSRILAVHPERPLLHAVEEVVNSEAPEFYLTPDSAKVIIYRTRNRARAIAAANARIAALRACHTQEHCGKGED